MVDNDWADGIAFRRNVKSRKDSSLQLDVLQKLVIYWHLKLIKKVKETVSFFQYLINLMYVFVLFHN